MSISENELRFCDALLQNRRAARAVPAELLLTYTVWTELFAKNFQTMLIVRGIVPTSSTFIFPPPSSLVQCRQVLQDGPSNVVQISSMYESSSSATLPLLIVGQQSVGFHVG